MTLQEKLELYMKENNLTSEEMNIHDFEIWEWKQFLEGRF